MATDHLQIADILANQNQKEVTANAAHNLLDRAMNQHNDKTVGGSGSFSTTETRENGVVNLIGTPGAPFTLNMPDMNERLLAVVNNTNDVATIRNSAGAGTGQPVLQVGEATIFHYDGTDFIDLIALATSISNFLALTDTPSAFANTSGQILVTNGVENALVFLATTMKIPVRAASTVNSDLATTFENGDTIDGVSLATGDRILIKAQTAGEDNGIYTVNATGAPTRADDFDVAGDMVRGAIIPVTEGTANANTIWTHTTAGTIVVDTTALTFTELANASTYSGLTGTPSGFINDSAKLVVVNDAESAVEHVANHVKKPVLAATTAAGTLTTDFENTDSIDGVSLTTGDRILIKNQASASENGIYTVEATGSPTRATDMDHDSDVIAGEVVAVLQGTSNANTVWQMTQTAAITLDTTDLTYVQASGGQTGRTVATLQTTDATITDIKTIAVGSGETVMIRGFGVSQAPSTDGNGYHFFATASNNAGTTTLAGQTVTKQGSNAAVLTIDADDTGDTIRIRATGIAATTIDWRVEYDTTTEA
jgi:hypothetical protein